MKLFKNIGRLVFILFVVTNYLFAQNPLYIPPSVTGTSFNLNIQSGTQVFYPGTSTSTYGINGTWMAPTIIVNKGDSVTLNVTNNLNTSTTIHWHGLHVAPQYDGGPHQIISAGSTWNPSFKIRNDASTFWYHPHGEGKTDLHVSKGLAGLFIVKDTAEAALNIPRTYGIDDFPVIVQSKAFDMLTQIAIATEDDTALFVNGTLDPYLNAPAQVIRLRLLNASSMRTYNFGLTADKSFKMIASDGGLLDSAITLTRIRLSPGERAEILVDLQGLNGQTLFLKNYGSEFPNGIYGAATVTGSMGGTIPGYNLNPLNGADYDILKIDIGLPTTSPLPVLTTPGSLVTNTPWSFASINTNRLLIFAPDSIGNPMAQVEGSFNINGTHFNMDSVNVTTYLNSVEKWRIKNNTGVAHPFHIHDIQFYILNKNGGQVPSWEKGKKDVVLVMPNEYVEFITKFEDFANDSIPYMYHCHMLHHEDDGMMGSFLVLDSTASGISNIKSNSDSYSVFPNPAGDLINIQLSKSVSVVNPKIVITNVLGKQFVLEQNFSSQNCITLNTFILPKGIYFVSVTINKETITKKVIITNNQN